jgi:hypothetical protein
VSKFLRPQRKATWALLIWFVIAVGLAIYAFVPIFIAPNGCPDQGEHRQLLSLCRHDPGFCRFRHRARHLQCWRRGPRRDMAYQHP